MAKKYFSQQLTFKGQRVAWAIFFINSTMYRDRPLSYKLEQNIMTVKLFYFLEYHQKNR